METKCYICLYVANIYCTWYFKQYSKVSESFYRALGRNGVIDFIIRLFISIFFIDCCTKLIQARRASSLILTGFKSNRFVIFRAISSGIWRLIFLYFIYRISLYIQYHIPKIYPFYSSTAIWVMMCLRSHLSIDELKS